ncbi:hypothetical protein [Candidatus Mycobacterium methanotrophicum]|uniref:Uncharacterized protein n=1 Tax=Candidatus Mycobacterium methanotrophicum TaxID=2943498 RepID=A0ABY4QLA6_9MYCO|nr:hypothetical protein [Candidatus Mycobacterium methanotrophicum]UQX10755.1 hypothetical protein M5I08_22730 [Candidatus Mycobacterium methanotrophicum]
MGGSRPPYDVEGYSEHDVVLGGNDDSFATDETPSAWFLKPWVLALWGLTVVILIGIIIYGLIILATGNGAGGPTTTRPSATTSHSTAPARTTTPPSALPTTTAPSPETTPQPAPPQITQTWTQQRPRHHWWNGDIPQIPGLPPIHIPGAVS